MKYFPCKKSYLCQVFPLNLNNNRLQNLFTIDMKVFMGCHYIFNFDISAYVPSIHRFNLLGPKVLTRITKMQIVIYHYILVLSMSLYFDQTALNNNGMFLPWIVYPFNLHPNFSRVPPRPDFSRVLSEIFLGSFYPVQGGSLKKAGFYTCKSEKN